MLKKYGMDCCNLISTLVAHGELLYKVDGVDKTNMTEYRSIFGSLMFLTNMMLDIAYVILLVSKNMSDPSMLHLRDAKQISKYVRGTIYFGIHYSNVENIELFGFSDFDRGNKLDARKYTLGNYFSLGIGFITWM